MTIPSVVPIWESEMVGLVPGTFQVGKLVVACRWSAVNCTEP